MRKLSIGLMAAGLVWLGAPAVSQADQVFVDDVIVDGSLCVGFDCVNGESFGFDTIRLKENNIRIHFDDTSNSASFPGNDWRIQINDSSNGGASYFGIEDSTAGRIPFRVEAGAPVNTLYVEADGDVGIKTANPVVDLHIVEGNTPTLRLEQDGSDGFTPQTYDIASNESNFFIRDVTNGSKLFFRSKPGAPEDSIFIAASGNIGLGTDAPSTNLHIKESSGAAELALETTDTSGQLWTFRSLTDGDFVIRDSSSMVGLRINAGTDNNLLQLGLDSAGLADSDNVHVNGNITATGTITPDYVFEPDYKLESIEEHAAFMWQAKHLPALAPAKADGKGRGVVNLVNRSQQVLEELEKAHIYIDQLHTSLKAKDAQLSEFQQRLANVEAKLAQ